MKTNEDIHTINSAATLLDNGKIKSNLEITFDKYIKQGNVAIDTICDQAFFKYFCGELPNHQQIYKSIESSYLYRYLDKAHPIKLFQRSFQVRNLNDSEFKLEISSMLEYLEDGKLEHPIDVLFCVDWILIARKWDVLKISDYKIKSLVKKCVALTKTKNTNYFFIDISHQVLDGWRGFSFSNKSTQIMSECVTIVSLAVAKETAKHLKKEKLKIENLCDKNITEFQRLFDNQDSSSFNQIAIFHLVNENTFLKNILDLDNSDIYSLIYILKARTQPGFMDVRDKELVFWKNFKETLKLNVNRKRNKIPGLKRKLIAEMIEKL
jgi:hypothetical protein